MELDGTERAQYRETLLRVQSRFGARGCSLALLDRDELTYVTALGPGAEALTGTSMSVERGLAGWVAQSEQAIVVDDPAGDPRFARDVAESTGYLPSVMVVAPVLSGAGHLLGVLSVLDPDRDRGNTGSDADIAMAFAGELGGTRPAWSSAFDPVPSVVADDLPVDAEWAFAGDGSGVRVAVLDSGIDVDHADVAGPVGPGAAVAWDGERGALVQEGPHEDLFGHGTACASVLRSIAPAAELASVRVLGNRLSGRGAVLAAGLRWAIDSGAAIVNLSLSSASEAMRGPLLELTDQAAHAGVVMVCAMNNTVAPTYPSSFGSVISVASCTDPQTWPLLANPDPPADFAAPGIDVQVAWSGGRRIRASGNSFAAPRIAGLAARLLSAHPHLTPYQVKSVLRSVAANSVAEVGA